VAHTQTNSPDVHTEVTLHCACGCYLNTSTWNPSSWLLRRKGQLQRQCRLL